MNVNKIKSVFNLTVMVAALGYFVDMFDITLYGVVRLASLKDMGLSSPQEILDAGIYIYNMQAIGMMVGGLLWGVIADKRGRLSVLFASIVLYSLGNIANAFVWDVHSYAICRFLTGFGLAGELGAAITLVAESLPKETRGLGTTVVATLGLLGAAAAAVFGQMLPWKAAYIGGGLMGLCLLLTRFKMSESGMFAEASSGTVARGDLRMLLARGRFGRYVLCILLGVPIYFITGILFTFSPELTSGMGLTTPLSAGNALLCGTLGLAFGDLCSGLLSQVLRSRRKAVGIHLLIAFSGMGIYLSSQGVSAAFIYVLCFIIGTAAGYWAVLVTMAAEQFGTNLRGTVASSVPNFVRGSAALVAGSFGLLKASLSALQAALLLGVVCFALAFVALWRLNETFGKDLDFYE
jgi:predicted MFS family arabinose efflux permease